MSIAEHMAGMAGSGPSKSEDHEPEKSESPVHEHLKSLHAKMGGKHMHIHHDGMQATSHQVHEDGHAEGPHNHENMEALKDHMNKFFNEEEDEGPSYGHEEKDGLM